MIEYRVRTPASFKVVVALLGVFAVACGGVLAWTFVARPPLPRAEVLILRVLCALVCVGAVAAWRQTAYRIGGGRGVIRFTADRLELPAATPGVLAYTRDALRLDVRDVRVRVLMFGIPAGDVRRGCLIELAGSAGKRQLSTLTLADPDEEPSLLADLRAFLAGQPARGHSVRTAPPPRTADDDRLDRELAELD